MIEQKNGQNIDLFSPLFDKEQINDSLSDKFVFSQKNRMQLSFVLLNIDKSSNIFEKKVLDNIKISIVSLLKSRLRKDDIIGSYGEECFALILPNTQPNDALHLCHVVTDEINKISANEKITLSVGISSYPENANSLKNLKEEAEKAFSEAREKGGDKIVISKNVCHFFDTRKSKIVIIPERNRVINNIINVIEEKDNFLLLGHRDPDEDCIASMVAFSLLIRKFYKKVTIILYKEYQHKFPYLMEICKYNSISVIESEKDIENNFNVIVALDTPKPSMLEGGKKIEAMIADKNILKMEIDHHLEADSGYIGDNNYCFVDEASSTCELIAYLTFKLSNKKEFLKEHDIPELFSRNFVVAIITGMISDSKMGKYLKSARQKLFYNYFSTLFNKMLLEMTNINSNNFSSMGDIFNELEKLSEEETKCYKYFFDRKNKSSHIAYTIVDKDDIDYFYKNFKKELIASIARRMADDLAEESGCLSLVVYYDNPAESDLIQFRMRRSHTFSKLDLRNVIAELKIENGGGHPGAVGFRFKQDTIPDLKKFSEEMIGKIENILNRVLKTK